MTSKEALQRIGEYSEAAITIRGTYFPPGKEPKEGERKIYLAIESMSVKLISQILAFKTWKMHPLSSCFHNPHFFNIIEG